MTGRLCSVCRIQEHDFCAGNFDLYVGGHPWPAIRYRCTCPCCPDEIRGVCDRCAGPCGPDTAAGHQTCRPPHTPARFTSTETAR